MGYGISLGIRTKEALGVTLLTCLVVVAATLIHLFQLTDIVLQELVHEVDLVQKQILDHSRYALLREAKVAPDTKLKTDQDLRRFLDASLGYSPHLLYALIADVDGRTMLHSEPEKNSGELPNRPRIEDLLALGPFQRVAALYKGGTVYENVLPMNLDGQPFASIRLGVHTSLLRGRLQDSVRSSMTFAAIALPVAWLLTVGMASLTLRPMHVLARQMEKLRQGDFEAFAGVRRTDEFRDFTNQLQLLGQQLKLDRVKTLSDKAQLQALVDQLADGIMLINQTRHILFCNRVMEAVLESEMNPVTGRSVSEVMPSSHPLRQVLDDMFSHRQNVGKTTLSIRSQGQAKDYLVSAFRVQEDGILVGVVVVLKDVESIHTLQSLVRYSAKLTALGRLTSGVVHEVKNPLNAMVIHLALLKKKLGIIPDVAQQNLEVIEGEIKRLDKALQGFLKFMRPQELNFKKVDLHALLHQKVALLEVEWAQKHVSFQWGASSSPAIITGDEELLSQVFLNILLNACQAMPHGGTVTLEIAGEGYDVVRVTVADEGVGIPEEEKERIFDLYYTTKADGSGMGLSIAYRIIQLHDGVIEVESHEGKGTTMTVRLPVGQ